MLLALTAAALAALVVVVGVFWFGWYETRQNRELLDSLPVFPGANTTQSYPHPYESDENPLSPPDKWVILRTYRVPDGTTKEDVAAFYMEGMPPEWERCLRHASTYDSVTGREGVLFTGAAFHSERTLVSVDVLNLGGSGRSYDVFLDRHRKHAPRPLRIPAVHHRPGLLRLGAPGWHRQAHQPERCGGEHGVARRRACPGRSLGSRDRGGNRQLPDDIRGICAAVLPAGRLVQHPAGHPGLGRGGQGSLAVPGQRQ